MIPERHERCADALPPDEAVELANATEFGLNAAIVGEPKAALKLASRLMAGSVNINEGYRATMASMGGGFGLMLVYGMCFG